MRTNSLKDNWIWLILWTGLVVSSILSRPSLPIDETRYLSVAWEMWQSNQFLVPHINGQPYSHKPPLLFWFIHFGWWLFGVNEWSARLISPLFGLASVFLTKRIAANLWPASPEVSRLSPLILLGTGVWSIYSTLTMFDTMIVFFSLAAYLVLLIHTKKAMPYAWPLLGLILGLGLLAKGPIILVYILPPMVLAPLWQNNGNINWWLWYGGALFALFVGCLLALTWAFPAAFAGGVEYGHAILFSQTAGRMMQSFAHQRPFYWYFLLLPLFLFPWTLWLPFWRGWKIECDKSLRFCFCILVPAFLALSMISGKQIHYILPLLPIVAIILGRITAAAPTEKPYDLWIYLIFFTSFALIVFLLPFLPIQGGDAVMLKKIPLATGLISLGAGFMLIWVGSRSKDNRSPALISVCMLLHLIFLQITLTPAINRILNPGKIFASLSLAEKQGKAIAVYPASLMDQFQFAARLVKPVVPLKTLQEMQTWAKKNPDGFGLIFVEKENSSMFGKESEFIPYRDGWLLFRQANMLEVEKN